MRTELRRGNWRALAIGAVLTRPEEPLRSDLAALGIWRGGRLAAMSGWDAVRTVGLGERNPPDAPVLVLSPDVDNRSVPGLVVRRTFRPYRASVTAADAEPYALIPVVHPARAVADTARTYSTARPVRALVIAAAQRRLCTTEELLAEYRSAPRAGSYFLRLALEDLLDGAHSVAEAAAARKLTRPGIPAFEMNVKLTDRSGTVLFSPDVYWRELRAILEVDSREYHYSEDDWNKTMRRHNRLTRLGFTVTHYPPSVITARDEGWLDEVQAWLEYRARALGMPMPGGRGPRRHPTSVII